MDQCVSGQLAQSESQKPFRCTDECDGKNKPRPVVRLIYLNARITEVKCEFHG